MGTSCDGVYFYGLLFDNDGEDGWPRVTARAAEEARIDEAYHKAMESITDAEDEDEDDDDPEDFDFDEWLMLALGVAPTYDSKDDNKTRAAQLLADRAAVEARCLEVFGVPGFDEGYMGYVEYVVRYVYPKVPGAHMSEWRGARVPAPPDAETLAVWERACNKLREMLPGSGEPGWHFGCSVG